MSDDQFFGPIFDQYTDSLYQQAAKRWNLNPALLRAQNFVEVGPKGGAGTVARGNPDHFGYGQLGSLERKQYLSGDPHDPAAQIDAQAHMLSDLITKHKGDVKTALLEYHGGPNERQWGPLTQAYPGQVLGKYAELGGSTQAPEAGAPPPVGFHNQHDDVFNEIFGGPAPSGRPERAGAELAANAPSLRTAATPQWGHLDEALNAALGGYGIKPESALETGAEGIGKLLHGHVPSTGELANDYAGRVANKKADEEAWQAANPTSNLAAQLEGGGLSATALGGAGEAKIVRPLADAAKAAVPALRPVVNFATGAIEKGPGVANWLARRASQAFTGAVQGAGFGALQSGESPRPIGEQMARGAAFGSVANPALHQAVEPLLSTISPMTATAASKLRALGVPLRAGQLPGAPLALRAIDSVFGPGAGAQRTALTQAVGKSFGLDAPVLSQEALNGRERELQGALDQFAGTTRAIPNDLALHHDLDAVTALAARDVPSISKDDFSQIKDIIDRIKTTGDKGFMSGRDYQNFTKRGSDLDQLMRSPVLGEHAIAIRDSLDDALERGIAQSGGKWVPEGAKASVTQAPENLLSGPKAQETNLLGVGDPNAIRLGDKAPGTALVPYTKSGGFQQPLAGTVENPPSPPPGPNMVWEYDPSVGDTLASLRSTRAQWRNMKVSERVIDPASGQVDPQRLGSAVQKAFRRNADSALPIENLNLRDLGGAGQFFSGAEHSPVTGVFDAAKSFAHAHPGAAAGAGLASLPAVSFAGSLLGHYGLEGLHYAATEPIESMLGLAGAGAAYGAGRGVNAALGSKANTSRLIINALSGKPANAQIFVDPALAGGVHLWNEPEDSEYPGTHVDLTGAQQ